MKSALLVKKSTQNFLSAHVFDKNISKSDSKLPTYWDLKKIASLNNCISGTVL